MFGYYRVYKPKKESEVRCLILVKLSREFHPQLSPAEDPALPHRHVYSSWNVPVCSSSIQLVASPLIRAASSSANDVGLLLFYRQDTN